MVEPMTIQFDLTEIRKKDIYDVSKLISKIEFDDRRLYFSNSGFGFGCNTILNNSLTKVFDVIHLDSAHDFILIPVDNSMDEFMDEFGKWLSDRQLGNILQIRIKEDYPFNINRESYKIKQKCLVVLCDTMHDVNAARDALEKFYNWEALGVNMLKTGYSRSKFLLEEKK